MASLLCSIFSFPTVIPANLRNYLHWRLISARSTNNKDFTSSSFFPASDNTFKYLFCCLPWSQGHKLAIDPLRHHFMSVHSVNVCVCAKNKCVCAPSALLVPVKSRQARTQTRTHLHSQWWRFKIIRTSNEMLWVECIYLTNADDHWPWSPSEGPLWGDMAWSATVPPYTEIKGRFFSFSEPT